ncbi:MAG: CHAD domain-containing protein [Thermoleophilia bacterium]|nr:CHAD domain-containing protein [Thermoleophilia bacterium]
MKAKRIKRTDPAGPLAENAAKIVKVRLEELRSFTPKALKPEAKAAQHDMRIAAKRLRYTLETTGFCFDRSADIARRRTKDLQDLLGEMHDADVMLPQLREHRREMREQDVAAVRILAADAGDLDPALAGRAPHIPAYRGIAVLEVDLIARRRFLFERFTEAWQSSERRGVWSALERSADRVLEEAARRREAAERAERARRELDAAETTRREAAERAELAAAELAEAERRSRG